MRNLKKILALVLALMMVLSVMVTASAASFDDAESISYKEAVEVMAAAGVLNGMGNGKFEPAGTLTRAQAAKIIAFVLLGADDYADLTHAATTFTDVPASHWASGAIAYCTEEGIINGLGNGKYGPEDTLTGYQFAKMLLCALGIEGTYTGDNWTFDVARKAKANTLMDGLASTFALKNNITREEAAQMAFNAMNYSTTGTEVVAYKVTVGGQTQTFASYLEAYVYANTFSPAAEIEYVNADSDSLMATNFSALSDVSGTRDVFGRVYESKWTYTDEEGNVSVVYAETVEADLTLVMNYYIDSASYANESLSAYLYLMGIVEDVEDVVYATGRTNYVDGKSETGTLNKIDTGDTVEIYMNDDDEITNIVIIKNYVSTVASFTEADEENDVDAYITLADATVKTVETEAYAVGDVVLYNKSYNTRTNNYTVRNLAKAESVTGMLTSYTSNGSYTIGGKTYAISAAHGAVAKETVIGVFGQTKVYSLDANGAIVAVNGVAGTEDVIPTDYAMILGSTAKVTTTTSLWGTTSVAVEAQVMVLLTDGSVAVYALPIITAEEDDDYGVAEDSIYTVINDAAVVLYSGSEDTDDAKDALEGALKTNWVYTYEVEDDSIVLGEMVRFEGTENEDAVGNRSLTSSVTASTTTLTVYGVATPVIVNEETVVIVADPENANTYLALPIGALQSTEVTSGRVIVDVTYVEDGSNVNVAKVIFAQGTPFKATDADAETAEDLVLITGTYTTSYDSANSAWVYTYTGYNLAGEALTLTGAKDLSMGIYEYDEDGVLGNNVTSGAGYVGVISGTTYEFIGADYYTVNSDTIVIDLVGCGLVTDAAVYYVLDGNVVVAAYIIGYNG